jgi:hypothetical protein
MTQVSTRRFLFRTAPGHIYTPAQERETESMCSPFVIQQHTITLAGADPFAAEATLTMTFLVPSTGQNGSFAVTIPAATTLAQAAALLAAAWNADPIASQLYTASSALAVVTLVARSANINIPAASITGVFSDAHTATVAQTVAPSAPSIQMGLFYVYASVVVPLAISGTPRGATPAALPTGATTIADLRGVVGRVVNQTTLSPTFNSTTSDDAYPAGQVWPGLLRGEICTRVDPASGAITPGGEVHVVIAAGAYSIVGAVAAAADGANTIRVDNAPTGNILARAIAAEETLQVFGTSTVGRYVNLKINRTN